MKNLLFLFLLMPFVAFSQTGGGSTATIFFKGSTTTTPARNTTDQIMRSGGIGIGLPSGSAVVGKLDVRGAVRFQYYNNNVVANDSVVIVRATGSIAKIGKGDLLPKVINTLQSVPTPTGNTTNLNSVFLATDGFVYFVDAKGNAIATSTPPPVEVLRSATPLSGTVPTGNKLGYDYNAGVLYYENNAGNWEPLPSSGGGGWSLTGNTGTDGGATNWIGTNDAQDFVIHLNGAEIGRFGQGNNITFGSVNVASGGNSVVSGGSEHSATGNVSTISGGNYNTANGEQSTIGGGSENTANGYSSIVSGGQTSTANGDYSSISGGRGNNTEGEFSTVSGGTVNIAIGNSSTVSGGEGNTAHSYGEWVGGLYSTNYTPNSTTAWDGSDYIFRVGNGQGVGLESDVIQLKKNGKIIFPSYISAPLLGTNAQGDIVSKPLPINKYDEVIATAGQTAFTLTETPTAGSDVVMFLNGLTLPKSLYTVTGTTIDYLGTSLVLGARVNFQYIK